MEKETIMKAPELPQLHQMVLENTEKTNKNEQTINLIRLENARQGKKLNDLDQRTKSFREEFEESMRRSAERMDRLEKFAETSRRELKESREKFDKEMSESRADFDRRMKEHDEKFDKEMKESREKFDKEMRESREKFDKEMRESRTENEKQNKELRAFIAKTNAETNASINASIRRISVEFLGVTGHMVEGLIGSSAEKIFQNAGLDLHDKGKNLKRVLAPGNRQMEIDAMLGNESIVVPIEVKEHFTKKKVRRWLQKMETFRDFFPECDDKEVFAAIAAINYEAGADAFAHEEGLLVVRVSSDDIFSLDPVDEDKLRKF